ncbi:uncharacterized protein [Canis lupus baileyi]|uniref:uncharacterized protein isoform X2 n=1 Tax=Canis lupus baileyi TaxID=143281 RepID=UPI0015F12E9E
MAVASTAAPARRFRPRSFGRCPGAGGGAASGSAAGCAEESAGRGRCRLPGRPPPPPPPRGSRTLLPFQACVGEGCCAPVSVRLGGSSPWLIKGHDCVCQRTKKGLSETITEAPTFNTALKEHSFTGSKERQTPKVYRQFSSSSTTITDLELTRKFPYGIHNDYSNNSSYITIELQITYISIVRMLILQLFKKLRYAARRQIYHQ